MVIIINIVFLCYAVSPKKIGNYSGVSVAGNKMQLNIIKNLNKQKGVHLKTVSVRPIAQFPNDKSIILNHNIETVDSIELDQISFLNLPAIKTYSQSHSVFSEVKKYLKKHGTNETIILTFNMFPQVGVPALKIQKDYGVPVVSIIADLPIDYSIKRGVLSSKFYGAYNNKTKALIKETNHLIVLNKYAALKFAPEAEYIVIDGGVDLEEVKNADQNYNYTEKNLMYCGSLHKYSGALNLALAMNYIESHNIYLDIYGDGEDKEKIIELTKTDNRIRYHGTVDNKTVMQKQREAFLLVNPRPVDDPISQVTFPSKIFEYILSGTPVLSTRLKGFTDEYNDKMIFFKDDSLSGLSEGINIALSKSDNELMQYSKRAYEFVVSERNWKKQTAKIHDYLLSVLNQEKD